MKKSLKWFAIALTIMMVFSVSFFTYTQAADSEELMRARHGTEPPTLTSPGSLPQLTATISLPVPVTYQAYDPPNTLQTVLIP